jgi:hypothetical protein
MSGKIISSEDAGLLIRKLVDESIPVVALFFCPDGAHSKLRGLVSSVTETGFVVSALHGEFTSLIAVPVPQPDGAGCGFVFGDMRGLPDGFTKQHLTEQYGDTSLTILLPSGSRLTLSFKDS